MINNILAERLMMSSFVYTRILHTHTHIISICLRLSVLASLFRNFFWSLPLFCVTQMMSIVRQSRSIAGRMKRLLLIHYTLWTIPEALFIGKERHFAATTINILTIHLNLTFNRIGLNQKMCEKWKILPPHAYTGAFVHHKWQWHLNSNTNWILICWKGASRAQH